MSDQDLNGQGDTGADDGGATTSFLDGITNEDLKGSEALTGHESLDSLADDYIKLKASQPAELPEDITGYEYTPPEGIQFAEENLDTFKTFALETGIRPDQYTKIMEYQTGVYQKVLEQQTEAVNKQGEEAVTRRKETLGAGYDTAVENSQKALAAFGAEDLKDDPAISNNDTMFNMLAKIGGAISEGKLNAGGDGYKNEPKKGEDGKPMLSFPSMEGQT